MKSFENARADFIVNLLRFLFINQNDTPEYRQALTGAIEYLATTVRVRAKSHQEIMNLVDMFQTALDHLPREIDQPDFAELKSMLSFCRQAFSDSDPLKQYPGIRNNVQLQILSILEPGPQPFNQLLKALPGAASPNVLDYNLKVLINKKKLIAKEEGKRGWYYLLPPVSEQENGEATS